MHFADKLTPTMRQGVSVECLRCLNALIVLKRSAWGFTALQRRFAIAHV
jgi:hypothetical protein